MKPRRIQLSRAKGWRMPPNTVKVDRSSKRFGNPFRVGQVARLVWLPMTDEEVLAFDFSERLMNIGDGRSIPVRAVPPNRSIRFPRPLTAADAVRWFAQYARETRLDVSELRGKNLACWCPLDQPCHADVLLELANAYPEARP